MTTAPPAFPPRRSLPIDRTFLFVTLLECALHLLRDARIYPDNSAGDAVLSGWLELAWQSAPDVAVAGLNEGMAPDSITGDPWIPDSARATLDLKTKAKQIDRLCVHPEPWCI